MGNQALAKAEVAGKLSEKDAIILDMLEGCFAAAIVDDTEEDAASHAALLVMSLAARMINNVSIGRCECDINGYHIEIVHSSLRGSDGTRKH